MINAGPEHRNVQTADGNDGASLAVLSGEVDVATPPASLRRKPRRPAQRGDLPTRRSTTSAPPTTPHTISWLTSAPFLVCHLIPLLVVVTGVHAGDLVLAGVLYVGRVFFITAGYHRYFSHRAFRVGRATQFVLAFGGLTAVQKGPLWWASWHRQHHRYADTSQDPHSPRQGFWWSHVGWILSGRYSATNLDAVGDLVRFPELRFLDRHDWVGPWSLAVSCYLIGGWSGLVVGFFGSTVLVWHATFSVNSFTHLFGRRRYETRDTSRNLAPVALLTLGEGWHNNHHHHPTSARQGVPWWELDVTYIVLRLLAGVGIVGDLRRPSPAALASRRLGDANPNVGVPERAPRRATIETS
jgi:stearoyl-CoA desaturase (Delta-9 desaturase)